MSPKGSPVERKSVFVTLSISLIAILISSAIFVGVPAIHRVSAQEKVLGAN
jgi:hypothetical protein